MLFRSNTLQGKVTSLIFYQFSLEQENNTIGCYLITRHCLEALIMVMQY